MQWNSSSCSRRKMKSYLLALQGSTCSCISLSAFSLQGPASYRCVNKFVFPFFPLIYLSFGSKPLKKLKGIFFQSKMGLKERCPHWHYILANKTSKWLWFSIIYKMKAAGLLFNGPHAGFGRYWFNLCLFQLGYEIISSHLSGENPARLNKAALLCQVLLLGDVPPLCIK